MQNNNWQDIHTIPHNKPVFVLAESSGKNYLTIAIYIQAFSWLATEEQIEFCMAEEDPNGGEPYLIEGLYEYGQSSGEVLFNDLLTPIGWMDINTIFPEVAL